MSEKIANIDKIYFINMDKSIDRLKNVQTQCKAANIECTRFPAVNGYNVLIEDNTGKTLLGRDIKESNTPLPPKQKFKITCNPGDDSPTTYNIIGSDTISSGQLGGWCSFIEVMKDAKRNSYNNIVIFEDDIKIIDPTNFANKLHNFISHVPQTFDFAFLGLRTMAGSLEPLETNSDISSVTPDFMAFGMHSFIASNQGLEKFLSYDTYDYTAKDVFLWSHASNSDRETLFTGESFECYVSSENLVYQNYDFQSLLTEMGRTH